MLMLLTLVLVDEEGGGLKGPSIGFGVGGVVTALSTGFDFTCGATFNPARDLAPRLFTAVAGWGSTPFGLSSARLTRLSQPRSLLSWYLLNEAFNGQSCVEGERDGVRAVVSGGCSGTVKRRRTNCAMSPEQGQVPECKPAI